jgi:hypothetical protein
MAKLTVRSGASSRSEYIFVNDASSTSGAGLTGLAFNTAGLTAYYVTERGTPTAISLVTLASATAAYSSGGFIAIDTTNLPGVYRLDVPAAVFATTKGVVMLKGATNMVPVLLEYDVVAYDPTDTIRLGLTSIPNVAQGSAGALPTGNATGQVTVGTNADKTGYSLTQAFPTNFASMAITAGGAVTAGTVSDKTGYSLTQTFPTNFSSLAITVGGAVTAGTVSDKTGYSLATAPPTAAQISTQVWSEALPGAFTSGQAGFKLDAGTATNVWGAGTRTLTAGTNIVLAKGTGITGFNDITSQSVWDVATTAVTAVGSMGVQLKTNVDVATSTRMATFTYTTPPTAASIATQVWSETLPGSYTSGQAGFKLNAAGSAADPWSTALPGAYSAGSAGNIIGNMVANTWAAGTRTLTAGTNIVLAKGTGITGFNDITSQSVWDVLASTVSVTGSMGLQLKTNIDTTVSSRMATFTYTTPPTAASISSVVWGDQVANYVNTGSFGYRLLRSDATSHSGDVLVQGNGSSNNHNRIDSDMHAIDSDHTAATNLKNLLPVAGKVAGTVTGIENITFPTNFSSLAIQTTTGYVTATNGGGGGGGASTTVRPGPFMLMAGNGIAGTPLDVQKGSVASISLQCVDANSTGIDLTGATVSTKVYNTAGTLIATYTNTASYSADGHTLCPLDATVTGTSGTYTANVWAVNGSNTTIYGPLRIYVRDI